MKLTINQPTLTAALRHATLAVERRHSLPILGNVLLDAAGEGLSVAGTDLDVKITEQVPARVEREGRTTAPAFALYDIVRKLPKGTSVELDLAGDRLHIRTALGQSTLATLNATDFPIRRDVDSTFQFPLPAADLRDTLERTHRAISIEATRYYLNGIYLHATCPNKEPVLRAVATDGHRLARVTIPLPEGADRMPGVIIPNKAVAILRKLLPKQRGDVAVVGTSTQMRFAIPGAAPDSVISLSTKLVDGCFPEYERVIPNPATFKLPANAIHAVLSRSALMAAMQSLPYPNLGVKLAGDGPNLGLSQKFDEGAQSLQVALSEPTEKPFTTVFQLSYLRDICAQFDGDHLYMAAAGPEDPFLFHDGSPDTNLAVLMPRRF